jgi:peptidoglycan glycosyltransferase
MQQALDVSCNTTFAKLGIKLGESAIYNQAKKFGFENSWEIPFNTSKSTFPQNLDKAQLAMSSIGQFNTTETVLQNALVVSAIDNGGIIMKPHLVKNIKNSSLQTVYTTPYTQYGQAISENTANELKKMMISVVKNGTGRGVYLGSNSEIGAKTGTAEKGKNELANNWFVSFVNKANKHLVVATIVENGGNLGKNGTGAAVAGPIAKAIMESYISNSN